MTTDDGGERLEAILALCESGVPINLGFPVNNDLLNIGAQGASGQLTRVSQSPESLRETERLDSFPPNWRSL